MLFQANPSYYVDGPTLQAIAQATGMSFSGAQNGVQEDEGSEEEEEEVVEEEGEEERPHQQHFALNGSAKFF